VVHHGWQEDAKPILVTTLQDKPQFLPNRWLQTVADFHDPTTYPVLRDYFIAYPRLMAYKTLQSLPNFDLHETVDAAWRAAQSQTKEQVLAGLLGPAAEMGEPDFPSIAMKLLNSSKPRIQNVAAKALRAYTPATGIENTDLINWMKKNASNLVFDAAARKFVLSAKNSSSSTVQ
jgi:hypothetical protein